MKLVLDANDIKAAITCWVEQTMDTNLELKGVSLCDDEGGWSAEVVLEEYKKKP